jgi:trehalose 6-phosphate phosphatase
MLSDIDGTLSRIVADPGSATIEPEVKAGLHFLTGKIDVVGVITGRSARDAARMLGLDDVVYLGNHGMERLERGRLTVAPEAMHSVSAIAAVLDTARSHIVEPTVRFENKGVTASIHYRGAANPVVVRDAILAVVTPLAAAANLRVSHGRLVIEIRPPVTLNKGTALREIVVEHALQSIIFLGDDVTDIDAMRALTELRDGGTIDGMSIGVLDSESPPEIARFADALVDGVDGVRYLLMELAERIRNR